MKSTEQVVACIVDGGLNVPLAIRLAQGFKEVLYTTDCQDAFLTLNKSIIGDGFEAVRWVEDPWKIKNEVDLWVFPDLNHSGMQLELESQGRAVWGSRDADSLETNREKFLQVLADLGLEVPVFEKVIGLTNLRKHLRDKEDKYIKISKYRGTMETTHWRSWREDEWWLDLMAVKLGPAKELMPFLVCDAIDTDLEIGGDTYCVDGQFPSLMLNGLEWKDKGYLGAITKREEMPEHIQAVMEAFAPILRQHRYRNLWSAEIRVKDGVGYFIDPCHRFPWPASGAEMLAYGNMPEIFWAGANGELIDPEETAKYVAECALTSKGDRKAWTVVDFPEELRPHIRCGGSCEIDGRICFPQDDSHDDEIGWLDASGDTIAETIQQMKEFSALLPDGVSANMESLIDLLKEAEKAENEGIPFAEEVPEPATVIEE